MKGTLKFTNLNFEVRSLRSVVLSVVIKIEEYYDFKNDSSENLKSHKHEIRNWINREDSLNTYFTNSTSVSRSQL